MNQEYNAKNHDDGIRGRVKNKKLCAEFLLALEEGQQQLSSNSTYPVFQRCKLNGVTYHAFKRSDQLHNSSVCKFKTLNGTLSFGSICCFCFCNQIPLAIIEVFDQVEDAFKDVQNSAISELNQFLLEYSCVFRVHKTVSQQCPFLLFY